MTEENLNKIKSAKDSWEMSHDEDFKKERKKEFVCDSGIPIKRVYTPIDLAEKGFSYERDLGFPGDFPFVRGDSAIGYRGGMWRSTQYAGYSTPQQSNELWKAQVEAGQTGIFIAYDLPTQLGYDPDHHMAEGEVGRVGVSLVSLRDWEVAFDGIDIGKVMVSQVLNAPGAFGVAAHLALAESRGMDLWSLMGSCQNDILKEYTARGNYIFPIGPSMRLTVDVLAYCGHHVPRYIPINLQYSHFAEAGASLVHHCAFVLANAFCYYQYAADRGIDVDLIAPGAIFSGTGGHRDFFQQIAKIRAMRKIYSRVMKERFKVKNPLSMSARFRGGCTGGSDLYPEQYLNNITRSAISCLAAAMAGYQTIDLRAYDEAFGIPTKEALLNALRTQQVVFHETGVDSTVDPLAGSYFVESLTIEFEAAISAELERIDKLGGVLRCIENGYFRRVMAKSAFEKQEHLEDGQMPVVGVNCFRSEEEDERPAKIMRSDPEAGRQRVAEVQQLRAGRDNRKVVRALNDIKAIALAPATADNNLMPPIIEAVKAYATVGEVCDALREVWGEHVETSVL